MERSQEIIVHTPRVIIRKAPFQQTQYCEPVGQEQLSGDAGPGGYEVFFN